jgi:magnesium transporter
MNYIKELKTRLTWLFIGLLLSVGIAELIKGFENTLQENLILASYIPMVVYMSDAVGTQMEAMIIRSLHKKGKFNFLKFLRQQALIVAAVSVIIGAAAYLIVSVLNDSQSLGLVVGISLICGILTSLFTGTVLPYLFWKLHNDPAEASGPIATAIQYLFSVILFFIFAQALL